jgi:hypothetical protein
MMQIYGRYSDSTAWIYSYDQLIIYYSIAHNASQDLCLGNCGIFFKFSINHYDAFLVDNASLILRSNNDFGI